jgi:phosphatidylglycerophosphate synthase
MSRYGKYFHNIWNIPNALTILRLLLVPVYVRLFDENRYIAALCVFVAASLTDLLDGYIARKYHLITAFGKLMDPLADKIMVLGGWLLVKMKDIVVFSSAIGKAAQFVFCLGLALSLLQESFVSWPVQPGRVFVYAAVALNLAALVYYALDVKRKLSGSRLL